MTKTARIVGLPQYLNGIVTKHLTEIKPKKSMVKYGVDECGGYGSQRWTWDGKLIARVVHLNRTSSSDCQKVILRITQ